MLTAQPATRQQLALACSAIRAVGAQRVALATPYVEAVSVANAEILEKHGLEVVSRKTLGLPRDELTTKVDPFFCGSFRFRWLCA